MLRFLLRISVTVTEIKALSQRIAVAKMLRQKMVYSEIAATGASTATISRVNRSLQYGCNGYDEIFKKDGRVMSYDVFSLLRQPDG